MDNVNNPYLGIAELVKNSGTMQGFSFCIGKVTSIAPLVIEGNNLSYSGDDLYINEELLQGSHHTASIMCTDVDGKTSDDKSITNLHIKNSTITSLSSTLTIGSKVLLLISDDKQTVAVLCKLRRC